MKKVQINNNIAYIRKVIKLNNLEKEIKRRTRNEY